MHDLLDDALMTNRMESRLLDIVAGTAVLLATIGSTRYIASGGFRGHRRQSSPFQLFLVSSSAAYSRGSACCPERLHHVCSDTVSMRDVRYRKLEPNALVHDSVQ
jgi:hypothetical protein